MFHWIADSRSGFVVLLMAAFIVAMTMYALPALLAWSMGSPRRVAITLVDLLLGWTPSRGWTILGWITALIWAIMSGNDESFDEDPPPRREPLQGAALDAVALQAAASIRAKRGLRHRARTGMVTKRRKMWTSQPWNSSTTSFSRKGKA